MEQQSLGAETRTRRGTRQAPEKPVVYDPSSHDYPQPTVKPLELTKIEEPKLNRAMSLIVIYGVIFGMVAGAILLWLNSEYGLLRQYLSSSDVTAHCLGWGAVVGGVYGAILSPLYMKSKHVLPIFALFLFLPLILFFMTEFLIALSGGLVSMLEALFSGLSSLLSGLLKLLGVVIVLFILYVWFCGG